MNGRICYLCGAGGCEDCIEIKIKNILAIKYICKSCQAEGFGKRVIKKFLEEVVK